MKLNLKNANKCFSETQLETVHAFVKYLQRELPLLKDTSISFDDSRNTKMTTGTRKPGHNIHVLTGNRLLIDILRTVSHEWVHEYQHQKMGLKDTDKIQDIGGPEENMANVLSGIFMKAFVKEFPHHEKSMYHENDL